MIFSLSTFLRNLSRLSLSCWILSTSSSIFSSCFLFWTWYSWSWSSTYLYLRSNSFLLWEYDTWNCEWSIWSILLNSGTFCPIVLFIRQSKLRNTSSNVSELWLWLCLGGIFCSASYTVRRRFLSNLSPPHYELIIWYSWSSSIALNFLSSFFTVW